MGMTPGEGLLVDGALIAEEREWLLNRSDRYTAEINELRADLGGFFDHAVESIDARQFESEVRAVLADPARACNVAGLIGICRQLDVTDDYPGFILDELLGRRLAATIAGGQPAATLAEATFHFADIRSDRPAAPAGRDDLDAAIIAGFQTRLPGWAWQDEPVPFEDWG